MMKFKLQMEIWLNVENVYGLEQFFNFEMNQEGVLRNVKTGRELKGCLDNHGFISFCLRQNDQRTCISKHRIMAELFIFNPLNLCYVNHKDGNRINNKLSNLRWCTHKENYANLTLDKRNKTGEMYVYKCLHNGRPYWRIKIGKNQKLLKRDLDSDEIPKEVLHHRDQMKKDHGNPT